MASALMSRSTLPYSHPQNTHPSFQPSFPHHPLPSLSKPYLSRPLPLLSNTKSIPLPSPAGWVELGRLGGVGARSLRTPALLGIMPSSPLSSPALRRRLSRRPRHGCCLPAPELLISRHALERNDAVMRKEGVVSSSSSRRLRKESPARRCVDVPVAVGGWRQAEIRLYEIVTTQNLAWPYWCCCGSQQKSFAPFVHRVACGERRVLNALPSTTRSLFVAVLPLTAAHEANDVLAVARIYTGA